MIQKLRKYLPLLSMLLMACLLIWDYAEGRPGGGSGYSGGGGGSSGGGGGYSGGGSSGGSSGGGGGDAEWIMMILYLIWIIIEGLVTFAIAYPYIALPLYAFVAFYLWWHWRKSKRMAVSSGPRRKRNTAKVEQEIARLKEEDPNFSVPVFMDFVTAFYHEYYSRFGQKSFEQLRPYLDPVVLASNNLDNQSRIEEIVVGTAAILDVEQDEQHTYLQVGLLTNFTETKGGKTSRHQLSERWTLARKRGLHSPEPAKMHALNCPNCGAGLSLKDDGSCSHCGTIVRPGEQQWSLTAKQTLHHQVLDTSAQALLTYTQEVGTDYATVVAPNLEQMRTQLKGAGNWEEFEQNFAKIVVKPTFHLVYYAWSSLKWKDALAVTSSELWKSFNFWIEAYRRLGLTNKLDDIVVYKMQICRVDVDRYYETITVRIHASCKDYVTDAQGKVLKGSKSTPRRFSEYWTFIKNRELDYDWQQPIARQACPNCGAPLQLNQAAECHSCGSRVNSGKFGWVLSTIEQDDDYGLEF